MRRVATIGLFAGLIASMAVAVGAREVEMTGEADVKVVGPYVWRGAVVNDEPVIQPEVSVTAFSSLTLNVWGTWDLQDTEETSARTRIDSSLDYTVPWKKMAFKGGMVAHAYHDDPGRTAKDTYEAYFDIAADVPFYPTLTTYYDFSDIKGFYVVAGLAEGRELNDWLSALMKVSLGVGSDKFNDRFYRAVPSEAAQPAGGEDDAIRTDKTAVRDLTVSLGFPMTLPKQFTLTPEVGYVTMIDSDLKAAQEADGDDPDNVFGSMTLAWEF